MTDPRAIDEICASAGFSNLVFGERNVLASPYLRDLSFNDGNLAEPFAVLQNDTDSPFQFPASTLTQLSILKRVQSWLVIVTHPENDFVSISASNRTSANDWCAGPVGLLLSGRKNAIPPQQPHICASLHPLKDSAVEKVRRLEVHPVDTCAPKRVPCALI